MGIMNKLMFWKKSDDFDFDSLANKDMANDPFSQNTLPNDPMQDPTQSAFSQPQQHNSFQGGQQPLQSPDSLSQQQTYSQQRSSGPAGTSGRELELISSKLDTIKAILNSMDQRISNLEQVAGVEQKQRQRLW